MIHKSQLDAAQATSSRSSAMQCCLEGSITARGNMNTPPRRRNARSLDVNDVRRPRLEATQLEQRSPPRILRWGDVDS